MSWLPLSLLCAFSLASADAATKAWLQGFSAQELTVVRLGMAALLMAPLLSGLPPLGSLPLAFWGWLAILVPLELLAMVLYMAAIRDHPLSLTVPYLALTPVFVIGTGWLLLGERVTPQAATGILLVVTGAWLLNGEETLSTGWRGALEPFRAILYERGSRLMLVVAGIYAVTSTMGKGAMRYLEPGLFGPLYFAVLGTAAILIFAIPRPRVFLKVASRPGPVLAVGALMGLMAYTHFLAIQQVEVAYMIAAKRLSLVFGILYGALIFKEPNLRRRLPAGALMVAGVVLIVL